MEWHDEGSRQERGCGWRTGLDCLRGKKRQEAEKTGSALFIPSNARGFRYDLTCTGELLPEGICALVHTFERRG